MFKSLKHNQQEKKRRSVFEATAKSELAFRDIIADIELWIILDCYCHSGNKWETIYEVPYFLDKVLVLKEVKKKCTSNYINNGRKLSVKNGTGNFIHVYGKETISFHSKMKACLPFKSQETSRALDFSVIRQILSEKN